MLKSFLSVLAGGAVFATICVADAQQADKLQRIGVVHAGGAYQRMVDGLRDGLRESGLQERKNFVLHEREVRDLKAVEPAARHLVSEGVHLLFTMPSSVTLRAKDATSDIPIVFYVGTDPVRTGLVQSFATPGGRLTGLYHPATDLGAKRLELVKQLLPQASRVLLIYDPHNPLASQSVQLTRRAAQKLGLEIVERHVRSIEEVVATVEALPSGAADILFQISDPMVVSAAARIGQLTKQRKLPMFALDLSTAESVALA
jgi:putative tryptophan/tyrosine transport system substrate-binding protein